MANDYIDQWNLNTVIYDIHDKGRGQPNGVATLDSEGRIPYSQLPEDALELKGYWDASTNTPELADGVGTNGDFYFVSVAGSQDLGSGTQYFNVGDRVLYDGSIWKNIASGTVRSINGQSPDAQGDISGIVTSVNGNLPNASGAVTMEATLSEEWKGKLLGPRTGLKFVPVFDTYNNYPGWMLSYNIAYGNGLYISIHACREEGASDYQAYICSSTDGIHWTKRYHLSSTSSNSGMYCYYRKNVGFFVYITTNPFTYYKSTDGIEWTQLTEAEEQAECPRLCYVDCEELQIYLFSDGSYKATKDEGETFTSVSLPSGYHFKLDEEYNTVCKGVFGWYAVIYESTPGILYSEDGISWSLLSVHQDYTSAPYGIAYMNGRVWTAGAGAHLAYWIEVKDHSSISWTKASGTYGSDTPYIRRGSGVLDDIILVHDRLIVYTDTYFADYTFAENLQSSLAFSFKIGVVHCKNGLYVANVYQNSSYRKANVAYSKDGQHWARYPTDAWYSYLNNPSQNEKQMKILGFYGGRWFLTYSGFSSTNYNAPYLFVSTLDTDIATNI